MSPKPTQNRPTCKIGGFVLYLDIRMLSRQNGGDMTTPWPADIMGIPVRRAPLGRNRSDPNGLPKTLCGIHDIEGTASSARATFAGDVPDGQTGGSTTFIADPGSGCFWQMLDATHTAYGLGNYPYNQRAIQCEFPGFAGRVFDANVVDYAARFIAWCKVDSGIPIEHISRDMTRAGVQNIRGVIAHMDTPDGRGGYGGTDNHTDPGITFPWTEVLDKAARYAAGSPPLPPTGTGTDLTGGNRQYLESHIWPTGYRIGRSFGGAWATINGIIPANTASGFTPAIATLGYPISREFIDEGLNPHLVEQYFERARLEKHPDGSFTIGLLGLYSLAVIRQYLPRIAVTPEGESNG